MPLLSAYNELSQYEEVGGDMIARIGQCNLIEVFKPIIDKYGAEPEKFNKVLFYILHTYSKESKHVINGTSPVEGKIRTLDSLGIEDEPDRVVKEGDPPVCKLRSDLLYLGNDDIIKTIQRYLRFQMSKPLEHLMMKRELYQQMLTSAIDDIRDGNGVIMYDQKFKNSGYADKLYSEIHEWEQKLMADNKELAGAIEEMRAKQKLRNRDSIRTEDFLDDKDE